MNRIFEHILRLVFMVVAVEMLLTDCSERAAEPVLLPDSTVSFPSLKPDGVSARITFSRYFSQKSGKQSAMATIFPLKENEDIYAVVELGNRLKNLSDDQMFHIDWVGPDGRSFYLKRLDLPKGDSTSALVSSISVSPGKRQPGIYKLRVYLFRELMAEKSFELLNADQVKKVKANIIFFKSMDKETGEMKGIDTLFEIKKKGILRAQIELSDLTIYKDEDLPVRLEWYGPDGESFYTKKYNVPTSDSLSFLGSSISITPDKRQPGEYFLRVYLFDDIVAEKRFVLKPSE